MLEYLITSRTKRNLLKLFFTNTARAYYVRELAKLSGEPLGAVTRELGYLKKAGLLTSRKQGNQKYYSINKAFPYYRELKTLILGTVGIGDYLSAKFDKSKNIEMAFVYGSVAKNEETVNSDIDLFVAGDIPEESLHDAVIRIENDIGRQVNYTLMSAGEFHARLKKEDPFIKRILKEEKILLKGSV